MHSKTCPVFELCSLTSNVKSGADLGFFVRWSKLKISGGRGFPGGGGGKGEGVASSGGGGGRGFIRGRGSEITWDVALTLRHFYNKLHCYSSAVLQSFLIHKA